MSNVGRYLFGLTAVGFGIIAFVWHEATIAQLAKQVGSLPLAAVILYVTAVADIAGGFMMLARCTLGIGAASIGFAMLVFTLLKIPDIVSGPGVYNNWGGLFEQLSLLCGAIIVFADAGPQNQAWRARAVRAAFVLFGLCVVSFGLEQAFYLKATAGFVPAWIPPSPMFWAVATTIAFALAALALLSGQYASLAAKLLTAMLVGFGIIVWLPQLFTAPPSAFAWSETIETFAIAAVAWIVAARLNDLGIAR